MYVLCENGIAGKKSCCIRKCVFTFREICERKRIDNSTLICIHISAFCCVCKDLLSSCNMPTIIHQTTGGNTTRTIETTQPRQHEQHTHVAHIRCFVSVASSCIFIRTRRGNQRTNKRNALNVHSPLRRHTQLRDTQREQANASARTHITDACTYVQYKYETEARGASMCRSRMYKAVCGGGTCVVHVGVLCVKTWTPANVFFVFFLLRLREVINAVSFKHKMHDTAGLFFKFGVVCSLLFMSDNDFTGNYTYNCDMFYNGNWLQLYIFVSNASDCGYALLPSIAFAARACKV